MDYWPSYIPKPSSLTESVDDPYIEATSETGDDAARVRYSKERQGPTKLTWKIMRLGDFVALKQFYAEHRAIEFLWLHPSRGLTYKTRFVSSPISSSEDGKSPFVAQVEVTLQIVELAPNEQDQPSVDDLMETVNTGADKAVQAAIDAGTARDAAQEAARQAATTAAEVLTSVEAGKQELQDEAQTQITAIESAGNEQIAAVQAEGATQTAAAKAQADAAAASAQEAADRLNEFKDLGATATTLAAGSEATASFDSSTGVLTIGVPQGIQGEAATIEVGTVTTLEPGSNATVTNSGTESEAVFDFAIPRGEKGDTGPQGEQGPQGDPGPQGEQGPAVPLSDAVDSESSTTAASSKAVKTAYDAAVSAQGTATAAQTKANACLPLAGGTMTGGTINWINKGVPASVGFHSYEGARIDFAPADYPTNPASFSLIAQDENTSCILRGMINGNLIWNGKNVETVNVIGTKYIRYQNGLQLCWGNTKNTVDEDGMLITFPVAFSSSPTVTATYSASSISNVIISIAATTTGFTVYSNAWEIGWIAIGKWV